MRSFGRSRPGLAIDRHSRTPLRRHIALYLGATLLAASALGWLAGLGWVYALASVSLGAVFLRSVIRQYRRPTAEVALRLFSVSNYYLGVVLLAIVLETLVIGG